MNDADPDAHVERALAATRRFHEAVREAVGRRLQRARREGAPELANRPGAWGAGDLSYALDTEAETALSAFGRELGQATVIAEGPGLVTHGAEQTPATPGAGTPPRESPIPPGSATYAPPPPAPWRALVDPVDGTRALMHELRSAWCLTGLAPDRGPSTRLSDVQLAVQTELPTSSAAVYHVLTARRGRGATLARHDVLTGECLESGPLRAAAGVPLDNGYFPFARYLPVERPYVARLEQAFLERALLAHDLSPRLVYDDQYLCSAGQLFLVVTGRYRMLADLRAWLGRRLGLANFTAKPYDLSTLLVYQEAGVPVLDAAGAPLDAPMDTDTALDVVAFGNERLREAFAPHLWAAMEQLEREPG